MQTEARGQVWAKTNGHCWYCGKLMNPWGDFTVDHMDPQKHGGGDEIGNLVPACNTCNSRKNAKTVEQYREYLYEKRVIRFWGEQAIQLPAVEVTVVEEEEAPSPYLSHLQSDIYSCLALGRYYGAGYAATAMHLYLDGLQNYEDSGNEGKYGDWFFHIVSLARDIGITTDEVFGHLMTLHNTNIIHITWSEGPDKGHKYIFNIDMLFDRLETMRDMERAQIKQRREKEQAFALYLKKEND